MRRLTLFCALKLFLLLEARRYSRRLVINGLEEPGLFGYEYNLGPMFRAN